MMVSRIAKTKASSSGSIVPRDDIEDLVQEVVMRVLTRLTFLVQEPVESLSNTDDAVLSQDMLKKHVGGFCNYINITTVNLILDKYKIAITTTSLDDEENADFFNSLISDEKDMMDEIGMYEFRITVYKSCLEHLFFLKSEPYILLGFCFNVLIHGPDYDQKKRGSASFTADAIAYKLLGALSSEFCKYHKKRIYPVPDDAINHFNNRLKNEGINQKAFEDHVPSTFYGPNPTKTIADWSRNTRKALLKALANNPIITEYKEGGQ